MRASVLVYQRLLPWPVLQIAADILSGLPAPLDKDKASIAHNPFASMPSGHDNSLGTVLQQVRRSS